MLQPYKYLIVRLTNQCDCSCVDAARELVGQSRSGDLVRSRGEKFVPQDAKVVKKGTLRHVNCIGTVRLTGFELPDSCSMLRSFHCALSP